MKKKYKAIIFDFNGTLLWDTPLHNKAWDIFLKEHHIRLTDKEKNTIIHGKTNKEIFKCLFKKEFDPHELNTLSEEKETIYRELCINSNIQLTQGSIHLFEFCTVKRIPISIATSSSQANVDFYIEQFGLLRWFPPDLIVFDDGTIKSKPDPAIFNTAMSRLNMKPNHVIIFEDSHAGIKAAEEAKAGKIVIVNSTNNNYADYRHEVLTDLTRFDYSALHS